LQVRQFDVFAVGRFPWRVFPGIEETASPGVDGKTWDDLQADIAHHLTRMVDWLKRGQYWPQPVRRVYIPKDATSMRPLGIPAIGDKISSWQ